MTPHKDHIFKGIGLSLCAFFLFAVMSASAKLLTDTHSVFELAFYRSVFALIPCLIYILYTRRFDLFYIKKRITLFLRVVIGISGLVLTFAAMRYMPMADATLIFMMSTLVVPAIASVFMAEKTGIHRWAAILFGLAGVALVVQPTGEGQMIGVIFAILAALTHAGAQLFLRVLKEENSFSVTFYFFVGGALLMLPFMPFQATAFTTLEDFGLLALLCISATLAQFSLSSALKCAPASTISPFNFSGLLWATLFDIVIWAYVPGWPVFLGGAMMLAAKLYILHRERKALKQV